MSRGYWRYPEDGLHAVGTADVTLKCAECLGVREVLVRFSADLSKGEAPDFVGLAIDEAGWFMGDHTVLCSRKCLDSLYAYRV